MGSGRTIDRLITYDSVFSRAYGTITSENAIQGLGYVRTVSAMLLNVVRILDFRSLRTIKQVDATFVV